MRAPILWVACGLLAIWLFLIPQLPVRYTVNVGYEEGYGSDLPLLNGFNTAEQDANGTYRWTADGAQILAPGLGRRSLFVRFDFLPVSPEVLAVAPRSIAVWSGGTLLAELPMSGAGRRFSVAVPAEALPEGRLALTLRSTTFSPAGDPRDLGAPLGALQIASLGRTGPVTPDWAAYGAWLLMLSLGWLILYRGPGRLADRPALMGRLLLGGALAIALAAWLDAPRWAFGARPGLLALSMAYVLTLVLGRLLPWLAGRLDLPLGASTTGWLALISGAAFALRYAGRLYPNAMHGDIGWHSNRMREALFGQIYLLSHNRGIDFPYPPGPYLVVAPFALFGASLPTILQFGAALVDALSAILIYGLAVRVTGQRIALLAGATYVFMAATFMTTWWSFDTHIYSQFFTLLVLALLALSIEHWQAGAACARTVAWWGWLVGLALVLVFVGHFGFLINTVLLAGGLLALTWSASRRGAHWARMIRWPLSLVCGGALLYAAGFFYSAYLPLFLAQAGTATTGGLAGLADREPIGRDLLWQQLWYKGLIAHFGFFPVVLTLVSFWRMPGRLTDGVRLSPAGLLLALIGASLTVSAFFGLLPFLTLVNSSTRWLMFSAWAVAIGAALGWRRVGRRGAAGRLVVLMTAGYVLWNTLLLWIGPMLYRIRPPEPF